MLVGFCIMLWLTDLAGFLMKIPIIQPKITINHPLIILFENNIFANILSLIITILNAFLIAQINNKFTIIRTRTFLPIFIFLMLISSWYQVHYQLNAHIALSLLILSLFNFFNMLRDNRASEQAFMGSLFISVSSLFVSQFLILIPICWIGFIIFQSLSIRTFLASVLGAMAPLILYFSAQYLLNGKVDFNNFFSFDFSFDFTFASTKLIDLIYLSTVFIVLIISIIALYSLTNSDAINTRNKLNFLVFLLFSLLAFTFFFRAQFMSFLPIIAFVSALLISHPLTLKQTNFYGILFAIFCVLNVTYVVFKYINL